MEAIIKNWTPAQLPDLAGKVYLITGANSGIGLEAARALAKRGAQVLLACRSAEKAKRAMETIREETTFANVEFVELDLADQGQIRAAAKEVHNRTDRLDGLINNAGIMMIPKTPTRDGYETQIGVNHLGHFTLTAGLLDLVENAAGRIVNLSSLMHTRGRINFEDLMGDKHYSPTGAYGQSKLANLLFTFELEQRMWRSGKKAKALACHPGYAATNLQHVGPRMSGNRLHSMIMSVGNTLLAQSAEQGAWPTILAAAGEGVAGGAYYGPSRFFEMRGPVGPAAISDRAKDTAVQKAFWKLSEEITGTSWLGLA